MVLVGVFTVSIINFHQTETGFLTIVFHSFRMKPYFQVYILFGVLVQVLYSNITEISNWILWLYLCSPFSVEFKVLIVISFQSELSKLHKKSDPKTPRLWVSIYHSHFSLFLIFFSAFANAFSLHTLLVDGNGNFATWACTDKVILRERLWLMTNVCIGNFSSASLNILDKYEFTESQFIALLYIFFCFFFFFLCCYFFYEIRLKTGLRRGSKSSISQKQWSRSWNS